MSPREFLSEIEQTVLLAVAGLDDEAYGMSIRREIERRSGRSVAIGVVYQTLDRLLDQGHLRVSPAAPSRRDGRARRFFTLTRSGEAALRTAAELHERMWAGIRLGATRGHGR